MFTLMIYVNAARKIRLLYDASVADEDKHAPASTICAKSGDIYVDAARQDEALVTWSIERERTAHPIFDDVAAGALRAYDGARVTPAPRRRCDDVYDAALYAMIMFSMPVRAICR